LDAIAELRRIKKEENLTYQQVADEMKVHYQSVINWISGACKPSKMARRIIRNFIVNHES